MTIKKQKNKFDVKVFNPAVDVYLTVTIGNAQIGSSRIEWNDENRTFAKGEISNLKLGPDNVVENRTLDVTTTILDANLATNGAVVTYYFHNCETVTITLTDTIDIEGGIVSFISQINFV
jgi:hypothetical protein